VKIWDLKTGQTHQPVPAYNGNPWFSSDGTRLVNGNPDGTVSVLSTSDWKELFRLSSPIESLGSFSSEQIFTHDSKNILVEHLNRVVTIWDAATGQLQHTITTPVWGSQYLFVLSPDKSRLATSTVDGKVTIWDVGSSLPLGIIAASPELVWMDFTPDGRYLTGMVGNDILMWNVQDLTTGRELLTLKNGNPPSSSVGRAFSYSPDEHRLVSAVGDLTPTVYDAETGEHIFTLAGHTAPVGGTAWSPDGTRIATASGDGTAKIWDAETGKELFTLSGHTGIVYAAAFSPNSQLVATIGADDGTVRIWDVASGQIKLTLDYSDNKLRAVAWSPDGQRIAAGSSSNGNVRIWNAETGVQQLELPGAGQQQDDRAYAVAFSPDGKKILTGSYSQRNAFVWDAATGQKLLTLSGHIDSVIGAAYSPDGSQIATSGKDGTAKLWDASNGKELVTIFGSSEEVSRVAFSPNGKHLATQNVDGTTRIYVLDIDELLALAQSRLTRTFTIDECQRYLHTDTCPA